MRVKYVWNHDPKLFEKELNDKIQEIENTIVGKDALLFDRYARIIDIKMHTSYGDDRCGFLRSALIMWQTE